MTADPPPAPKRAKVVQATNRSAASTATHHAGPSYAVTGLHIRDRCGRVVQVGTTLAPARDDPLRLHPL